MTDLTALLALAQTAVRWAQTSEQRERAMKEVDELKAKIGERERLKVAEQDPHVR